MGPCVPRRHPPIVRIFPCRPCRRRRVHPARPGTSTSSTPAPVSMILAPIDPDPFGSRSIAIWLKRPLPASRCRSASSARAGDLVLACSVASDGDRRLVSRRIGCCAISSDRRWRDGRSQLAGMANRRVVGGPGTEHGCWPCLHHPPDRTCPIPRAGSRPGDRCTREQYTTDRAGWINDRVPIQSRCRPPSPAAVGIPHPRHRP